MVHLGAEVLAKLHYGHIGTRGMQARARDTLFWPGMHTNIERIRGECSVCHKIAPRQAATPPKPPPVLNFPFQMVSSDYF